MRRSNPRQAGNPPERRWQRANQINQTAQKSVVPQIHAGARPAPETSEADLALVKSTIDTLRSGGAGKGDQHR